MSQVLRLEYTCTKAELEEAQTLDLRRQLGRGSKWRTRIILVLVGAVMILGLALKIRREVPPKYWPHMAGGVLVLIVIISLWQRRSSKKPHVVTQIEVSEVDLTILSSGSKVTLPWSAFSGCLESANLFVLMDRPKGMLYVLPKRAFPSDSWQGWFRSKATNPPALHAAATLQAVGARSRSPDQIAVCFQLGFRDSLDRTLGSWRTWGFSLGLIALVSGVCIFSAINPPPDAIYSSSEVFFKFMLPFVAVTTLALLALTSVVSWRAQKKYPATQDVLLSNECIDIVNADSTVILPWSTYTRYKERRRSFILWNASDHQWFMIPKRSFTSREDLDRCRALLAAHLQKSRWFFG